MGTIRKNKRVSRNKVVSGKRGKGFKLLAWIAGILIFFSVGAGVTFLAVYMHFSADLPSVESLKNYQPPTVTTVYADNGEKIAEFCKQRRIVVPYERIPEQLIQAFVAAEDSRFFTHPGVDIKGIVRAFFKNMEAGTIVQGGSTITQQVTKSFLLTPERSYERKFKEAILAYRIDQEFSKAEILHLYLNQIYLGHGAYGVQAAAENYFDKSVEALNLSECAMLAGLPQAPSRYSPLKNPDKARARQEYVLNRMEADGYITPEQKEKAINAELAIKPRKTLFKAPYYTEHVRRYVLDKYGEDMLYNQGLKIYTAVNLKMQDAARTAVRKGLRALDKRHGYRGPVKSLEKADISAFVLELVERREARPLEPGRIVEGVIREKGKGRLTVDLGGQTGVVNGKGMRWIGASWRKKLQPGDIIEVRLEKKTDDGWRLSLEQSPEAQSALLCAETGTGRVKAMIGGSDYGKSQFNRAIQAQRQPGSSFKPIIYAAALDKGYTPATQLIDNAIVYDDGSRKQWRPRNYDRRFTGPILLRKALAKSRNLATIRILDDIGVEYAISYAHKLGIRSRLYPDLSTALGASGVSLLEMVTAYSVFANLGERIAPVFVTRIEDRNGEVLEAAQKQGKQVIEKSTAYLMTSLLKSVIQEGTGRRARALKRPAAGKTGTTNDTIDAWFMGFTPRYVAGAWVGHDEKRSLGRGETGSRAALPVWLDFMQRLYRDVLEDNKPRKFEVPKGVVFAKIDAETGLLPVPQSDKTLFECFKEGTAPTEYSSRADNISQPEQFFKNSM